MPKILKKSINLNKKTKINESIRHYIFYCPHKCMLKNLHDCLGNKVVFVHVERSWIITCGNLNCNGTVEDIIK